MAKSQNCHVFDLNSKSECILLLKSWCIVSASFWIWSLKDVENLILRPFSCLFLFSISVSFPSFPTLPFLETGRLESYEIFRYILLLHQLPFSVFTSLSCVENLNLTLSALCQRDTVHVKILCSERYVSRPFLGWWYSWHHIWEEHHLHLCEVVPFTYGRCHDDSHSHLEHSGPDKDRNRKRERILLMLLYFALWEKTGIISRP